MQPPIVGGAEILTVSGPEVHGHAGENVAAERIVPFGIGIAVERPIAGRGIADDERRLPVQDIIDAKPKLEPLPKPEDGGNVEIVLRPQLRVRRTNLSVRLNFGSSAASFTPPICRH